MQAEVTQLWGRLISCEAFLDVICSRITKVCVRDVKGVLVDLVNRHVPAFDIVVDEHVVLFHTVEWANNKPVTVGQLSVPLATLCAELKEDVKQVVCAARKQPQLFTNLSEIAESDLHESVRQAVVERERELKGFRFLDLDTCQELKKQFYERLLSYILYKYCSIEAPHVVGGVLLFALRALLQKSKDRVFSLVCSNCIKALRETLSDADTEVGASGNPQ